MESWLILKRIKSLDLTVVLLVCSLFFIGYMYIYFTILQSKRVKYELYNENLYMLKVLNNELDNFVLNDVALKNYDFITEKIKKFERTINSLENSLVYKEFQDDLSSNMNLIREDFLKKRKIVEVYKSYQASILYSFSYMIQIQKELQKEYKDEKAHELMSEILFGLLQLYLNLYHNDIDIEKNIDYIEKTLLKSKKSSMYFFILHSKMLYREISRMNERQKKYLSNRLYEHISQHQTIYLTKFKEMDDFQKKIYNFMFIFSMLLLVMLLFSYLKALKLKKDLISFKYAVENSDDSIVVTDVQRHIVYVNEAFTRVTGYTKEEALGQNPNILKSGHMSEEFYKNMNKILDNGEKWSGEFINKDKNGEIYYERASITPMFVNKKLNGYLAIKLNITDYVKEKNKVEFLAYHDSLTSLPNRRMMKEIIAQEIEKGKEEDLHVDLLFLDLDGFKSINDTLGHNVGDFFLQEITKKLEKFLSKKNALFRTGGDEFAVLLSYKDGVSQSNEIASKIISIINEPIYYGDNELTVGVSIGIAKLDILNDDVISLLKHADIAMYEAKNSGKNRFCNYTQELSGKIEKKLEIKQALGTALKKDEFYVMYQPKYALKTKKVFSLEALIRWEHPTLGMISPEYFIPIAEDTRLIQDIGIFVFKQACFDFIDLKKRNKNLESISINLSPAQLMNTDLLEELKNIIIKMDIKAENIGLEITETHIMHNIEKATLILKEMKDFGFKIIVDDFGTGYSSMSYLKKLPISELKIDKSFIDDICKDENDVKIVKAIISIAKSFDYEIVAEGIETNEQENLLKELGVDTGQGYHFSKPKKKEELF